MFRLPPNTTPKNYIAAYSAINAAKKAAAQAAVLAPAVSKPQIDFPNLVKTARPPIVEKPQDIVRPNINLPWLHDNIGLTSFGTGALAAALAALAAPTLGVGAGVAALGAAGAGVFVPQIFDSIFNRGNASVLPPNIQENPLLARNNYTNPSNRPQALLGDEGPFGAPPKPTGYTNTGLLGALIGQPLQTPTFAPEDTTKLSPLDYVNNVVNKSVWSNQLGAEIGQINNPMYEALSPLRAINKTASQFLQMIPAVSNLLPRIDAAWSRSQQMKEPSLTGNIYGFLMGQNPNSVSIPDASKGKGAVREILETFIPVDTLKENIWGIGRGLLGIGSTQPERREKLLSFQIGQKGLPPGQRAEILSDFHDTGIWNTSVVGDEPSEWSLNTLGAHVIYAINNSNKTYNDLPIGEQIFSAFVTPDIISKLSPLILPKGTRIGKTVFDEGLALSGDILVDWHAIKVAGEKSAARTRAAELLATFKATNGALKPSQIMEVMQTANIFKPNTWTHKIRGWMVKRGSALLDVTLDSKAQSMTEMGMQHLHTVLSGSDNPGQIINALLALGDYGPDTLKDDMTQPALDALELLQRMKLMNQTADASMAKLYGLKEGDKIDLITSTAGSMGRHMLLNMSQGSATSKTGAQLTKGQLVTNKEKLTNELLELVTAARLPIDKSKRTPLVMQAAYEAQALLIKKAVHSALGSLGVTNIPAHMKSNNTTWRQWQNWFAKMWHIGPVPGVGVRNISTDMTKMFFQNKDAFYAEAEFMDIWNNGLPSYLNMRGKEKFRARDIETQLSQNPGWFRRYVLEGGSRMMEMTEGWLHNKAQAGSIRAFMKKFHSSRVMELGIGDVSRIDPDLLKRLTAATRYAMHPDEIIQEFGKIFKEERWMQDERLQDLLGELSDPNNFNEDVRPAIIELLERHKNDSNVEMLIEEIDNIAEQQMTKYEMNLLPEDQMITDWKSDSFVDPKIQTAKQFTLTGSMDAINDPTFPNLEIKTIDIPLSDTSAAIRYIGQTEDITDPLRVKLLKELESQFKIDESSILTKAKELEQHVIAHAEGVIKTAKGMTNMQASSMASFISHSAMAPGALNKRDMVNIQRYYETANRYYHQLIDHAKAQMGKLLRGEATEFNFRTTPFTKRGVSSNLEEFLISITNLKETTDKNLVVLNEVGDWLKPHWKNGKIDLTKVSKEELDSAFETAMWIIKEVKTTIGIEASRLRSGAKGAIPEARLEIDRVHAQELRSFAYALANSFGWLLPESVRVTPPQSAALVGTYLPLKTEEGRLIRELRLIRMSEDRDIARQAVREWLLGNKPMPTRRKFMALTIGQFDEKATVTQLVEIFRQIGLLTPNARKALVIANLSSVQSGKYFLYSVTDALKLINEDSITRRIKIVDPAVPGFYAKTDKITRLRGAAALSSEDAAIKLLMKASPNSLDISAKSGRMNNVRYVVFQDGSIGRIMYWRPEVKDAEGVFHESFVYQEIQWTNTSRKAKMMVFDDAIIDSNYRQAYTSDSANIIDQMVSEWKINNKDIENFDQEFSKWVNSAQGPNLELNGDIQTEQFAKQSILERDPFVPSPPRPDPIVQSPKLLSAPTSAAAAVPASEQIDNIINTKVVGKTLQEAYRKYLQSYNPKGSQVEALRPVMEEWKKANPEDTDLSEFITLTKSLVEDLPAAPTKTRTAPKAVSPYNYMDNHFYYDEESPDANAWQHATEEEAFIFTNPWNNKIKIAREALNTEPAAKRDQLSKELQTIYDDLEQIYAELQAAMIKKFTNGEQLSDWEQSIADGTSRWYRQDIGIEFKERGKQAAKERWHNLTSQNPVGNPSIYDQHRESRKLALELPDGELPIVGPLPSIKDKYPLNPNSNISEEADQMVLLPAELTQKKAYETWHKVNQIKERLYDVFGKNEKVSLTNLDAATLKQLEDLMNHKISRLVTARSTANKVSAIDTDQLFYNYGETYNFDSYLNNLFGYPYWYLRTFSDYPRQILTDPNYLAKIYSWNKKMLRLNEDENIPFYMKSSIKGTIPNVWGLQDMYPDKTIYYPILSQISPLEQILNGDLTNAEREKNTFGQFYNKLYGWGPGPHALIPTVLGAALATVGLLRDDEDLINQSAQYFGYLGSQTRLLSSATAQLEQATGVTGLSSGGTSIDYAGLALGGAGLLGAPKPAAWSFALMGTGAVAQFLVTHARTPDGLKFVGPIYDQKAVASVLSEWANTPGKLVAGIEVTNDLAVDAALVSKDPYKYGARAELAQGYAIWDAAVTVARSRKFIPNLISYFGGPGMTMRGKSEQIQNEMYQKSQEIFDMKDDPKVSPDDYSKAWSEFSIKYPLMPIYSIIKKFGTDAFNVYAYHALAKTGAGSVQTAVFNTVGLKYEQVSKFYENKGRFPKGFDEVNFKEKVLMLGLLLNSPIVATAKEFDNAQLLHRKMAREMETMFPNTTSLMSVYYDLDKTEQPQFLRDHLDLKARMDTELAVLINDPKYRDTLSPYYLSINETKTFLKNMYTSRDPEKAQAFQLYLENYKDWSAEKQDKFLADFDLYEFQRGYQKVVANLDDSVAALLSGINLPKLPVLRETVPDIAEATKLRNAMQQMATKGNERVSLTNAVMGTPNMQLGSGVSGGGMPGMANSDGSGTIRQVNQSGDALASWEYLYSQSNKKSIGYINAMRDQLRSQTLQPLLSLLGNNSKAFQAALDLPLLSNSWTTFSDPMEWENNLVNYVKTLGAENLRGAMMLEASRGVPSDPNNMVWSKVIGTARALSISEVGRMIAQHPELQDLGTVREESAIHKGPTLNSLFDVIGANVTIQEDGNISISGENIDKKKKKTAGDKTANTRLDSGDIEDYVSKYSKKYFGENIEQLYDQYIMMGVAQGEGAARAFWNKYPQLGQYQKFSKTIWDRYKAVRNGEQKKFTDPLKILAMVKRESSKQGKYGDRNRYLYTAMLGVIKSRGLPSAGNQPSRSGYQDNKPIDGSVYANIIAVIKAKNPQLGISFAEFIQANPAKRQALLQSNPDLARYITQFTPEQLGEIEYSYNRGLEIGGHSTSYGGGVRVYKQRTGRTGL